MRRKTQLSCRCLLIAPQRCGSILSLASGTRTIYAKLNFAQSFQFYVVSRKARDYCYYMLSGRSVKSHAVFQDRPLLLLFAHYFKTSLSQKKCKARRSIWMRHEGKILGILFVSCPGSLLAGCCVPLIRCACLSQAQNTRAFTLCCRELQRDSTGEQEKGYRTEKRIEIAVKIVILLGAIES